MRGAPPKIINDIFTDGFTPPTFRAIVKNLGTTDITTTIELLPDIYVELDIYLRWLKIFEDKPTSDDAKRVMKQQKITGGKATFCSH